MADHYDLIILFVHHTFFFTFYRTLFAHVSSLGTFIIVCALQVVADVFSYIVPTIRLIHRWRRRMRLRFRWLCGRAAVHMNACCCGVSAHTTKQELLELVSVRFVCTPFCRRWVDHLIPHRTASVPNDIAHNCEWVVLLIYLHIWRVPSLICAPVPAGLMFSSVAPLCAHRDQLLSGRE